MDKEEILDKENLDNVKIIMEKLKPFIALAVLILIIFSSYNLYQYINLQKEIKDSCGYYPNEKVYCICDKDFVSQRYVKGNPYYNGSETLDNLLGLPEGVGS